uniref:Flagellar hook-associated protein 1 n=1 Tax=Thermodesulfobacterium geofontis TaxID=1295609 RepID=A0A7V4N537_9BACT
MAGLTAALNIAKNALLTFQTATQVISHNVANVSNEAYCRQKPIETTYPSSPSPAGPIGSGVKIEMIQRYFDAFLEKNINLKRTDYGLFSAEETGLTILETLFNEVTNESGLINILQNFWIAWQNLSNYPENLSARTQIIETGKLIVEALKAKFKGLQDLEIQIGLKLKTIVERINALSSQIAELNLRISAMETGGKLANDLRDQRDKLVGELSQLVSIQYFETKEGAYNIVLGKGFNLVELGRTWKLEVSGTDVYWISTKGEKIPLTSKEVSSGELGGWLRLLEQLSDEFNYEYVSGNKVVYNLSGELISEADKLVDLGLSGTVTFNITGTDHFGNEISGNISYNLVANPNVTLKDLLNKIEELFNYTVSAYIRDGRLFIENKYRGSGELKFSITGPIDFGSFDDPTYQRRVVELNFAGRLKLFGEELIKAVNELHTQGVGLFFYEKELEGAYWVNQYIKELPYFLDITKTSDGSEITGFFYIWIKDDAGKITPVKVSLDGLSVNATLNDLANRINSALNEAGFYNDPTNWKIRSLVRNGRLVFQAQEGYSFGFSNDTSRILLATGINIFFVGSDPANFRVNELLVRKPELIASGKMDISAFRSEEPLFGIFESSNPIDPSQTFNITKLYIRLYDQKGNVITSPPLDLTNQGIIWNNSLNAYEIDIDPSTTLQEILNKLNSLPFLRAYVNAEGKMVLTLDPNQTTVYGFEIGDNSSTNGFVDLLKSEKMYIPAFKWYDNSETRVITGFERFNFDQTKEDYLSFYLFDENGNLIKGQPFRISLDQIISDGGTIFTLLQKINSYENAVNGLSARFDRNGKLIIETTGLYDTKTFIIQDELYDGTDYVQTPYNYGFINTLKGYELERGDNRIAQAIADSATIIRKSLNYSTLQNYYSSIVGEVGSATNSVKDSKSFLETLISQLKNIKESISGVSLDEEMANLIKYQQAFVASAKVLTTVEDMFEALLNAKR